MIAGPTHEAIHRAVRIDKAIAGTERPTDNIVRAKLRKHVANIVCGEQADVFESQAYLGFVISLQIRHVLLAGCAE